MCYFLVKHTANKVKDDDDDPKKVDYCVIIKSQYCECCINDIKKTKKT